MGPQWLLDGVIFLAVIVFLTWPMCRVCSKAGYSPSLGSRLSSGRFRGLLRTGPRDAGTTLVLRMRTWG